MAEIKMTPARLAVLRAVAAGALSESRDGALVRRARLADGYPPIATLDQRVRELRTAKLIRLAERPPQLGTYWIDLKLTVAGQNALAEHGTGGK